MTIKFRKGEAIHVDDDAWKATFVITSGILDMLKKVVNSREIIMKPVINDPSYD